MRPRNLTGKRYTKTAVLNVLTLTLFLFIFAIHGFAHATPSISPAGTHALPPVYLAFDGAFGQKTNTAANAIKFGLNKAIEDINAAGGVLGGRPLALITTDNKGITARGKDNFIDLSLQKDMVAIFGGKYSPIIIESLTEAQRAHLPIISVWGSADQITDNGYETSYAFRVPLKDSWGVPALINRIVKNVGASTACAFLPNTAWGRSSEAVIKNHSRELGLNIPLIRWFNWGEKSFTESYSQCLDVGAQALLFVGNEMEAAVLIKEVAIRSPKQRLPIVAHWGTVGGTLHQLVGNDLNAVRLEIIQTFTFVNNKRPLAMMLASAAMKAGAYASVAEIPSPVGIAQAYDAARLVARAIDLAQSTDGREVRAALENLPDFEGAIKDYSPAFTAKQHDALDASSVIFVKLEPNGALIPLD